MLICVHYCIDVVVVVVVVVVVEIHSIQCRAYRRCGRVAVKSHLLLPEHLQIQQLEINIICFSVGPLVGNVM